MDHEDHVHLLRGGIGGPGGIWADLGCGTGAFTLALADLVGPGAQIYALDKDQRALRALEQVMSERFPAANVHYVLADFTRYLDLPPLDGVVMANSLHYLKAKEALVQAVRDNLKPSGRLILVEYNVDRGNVWVPYPLSFPTWEALARACGFTSTRLLATSPSRFLREMYAAVSVTSEM